MPVRTTITVAQTKILRPLKSRLYLQTAFMLGPGYGEPVAWIAGDYGLMRVLLDRPAFSKRIFRLYPSQIMTADGTPIPLQDGKELVLKYDDRDFKIRFGTDHFSVGNDLSYQASLEGKVVHRSPSVAVPVWRSGALNAGVIYSLFAPRIVTAWKAMSSNLLSLSSHTNTAQSGWRWSGDRWSFL